MAYHYSDKSRESDPHAMPDLEVFAWPGSVEKVDSIFRGQALAAPIEDSADAGWYYAFGFPGCLWDSDPVGPFDSEAEALADARESVEPIVEKREKPCGRCNQCGFEGLVFADSGLCSVCEADARGES